MLACVSVRACVRACTQGLGLLDAKDGLVLLMMYARQRKEEILLKLSERACEHTHTCTGIDSATRTPDTSSPFAPNALWQLWQGHRACAA